MRMHVQLQLRERELSAVPLHACHPPAACPAAPAAQPAIARAQRAVSRRRLSHAVTPSRLTATRGVQL